MRPPDHDYYLVVMTHGRDFGHRHRFWTHRERWERPAFEHVLGVERIGRRVRSAAIELLITRWIWPVVLRRDRERAKAIAPFRFRWRWVIGRMP